MSFREEQCNKVCRILDDVLANRPTERDSLITAVRIAFSALNCSEIPNSSDSISRQAAIAEFNCCELTPDGGIDANYAIDFLEQLPPVQPEIIKCKDCKHWEIHKRLDIPWCRCLHSDMGADDYCSYAELRGDSDY